MFQQLIRVIIYSCCSWSLYSRHATVSWNSFQELICQISEPECTQRTFQGMKTGNIKFQDFSAPVRTMNQCIFMYNMHA